MKNNKHVAARGDSPEATSRLTKSASSAGDRHTAEKPSAARASSRCAYGNDTVLQAASNKKTYICDRCGMQMSEKLCKITCPNCGNRFDCSDLNIYFD